MSLRVMALIILLYSNLFWVDEVTPRLWGLSAYPNLLTLPLANEVLISLMLKKSNEERHRFISINLCLWIFEGALMFQVERGLDY
jgi:hypothetical protein